METNQRLDEGGEKEKIGAGWLVKPLASGKTEHFLLAFLAGSGAQGLILF
mgnify:CR=1 FL=1